LVIGGWGSGLWAGVATQAAVGGVVIKAFTTFGIGCDARWGSQFGCWLRDRLGWRLAGIDPAHPPCVVGDCVAFAGGVCGRLGWLVAVLSRGGRLRRASLVGRSKATVKIASGGPSLWEGGRAGDIGGLPRCCGPARSSRHFGA